MLSLLLHPGPLPPGPVHTSPGRQETAGRLKRLDCLDGLRGLLAVYVLLGHMAPFAVLPDWLQAVLSHGQAAVDVFFILSGLVITQSLLHAASGPRQFLILRAARIFPVYVPVFALAVLLEPWSCGFDRMPWIGPDDAARTICVTSWPDFWVPEILAHLTMTHGLFPDGVLKHVWVSFLGSAWSLSTEWQFYLLALLVIGCRWVRPACAPAKVIGAGVGRTRGPALTRFCADGAAEAAGASRRLCWALLALAAAGVAWRLTVPEYWLFSRAFLPNKAHFFALGVAAALVVRQESGALLRYAVVLALTLVICATQAPIEKILAPLAWTACLTVQMLPEGHGLRWAGWLLRTRTAQYLGALSYCLYLVNEPIHKLLVAALSRIADTDALLFTLVWIPAAIVLPFLISVWLHRHVEVPALQFGRTAAGRVATAAGDRAISLH